MSIPLVINGVTFNYPQQFDTNWGPTLTNWSQAVTNAIANIAFNNASFNSVTSLAANPALTGFIRVPNNTPGITWRNFANSADLPLTVDVSNNLLFNGVAVGNPTTLTNTHIFVGNVSNVPTDVAMSGDVHISNTGATTIQSASVTGAKIASSTITESNITAGTITNASINTTAAIALSKLTALNAFISPVTDTNGFLVNSATTATEIGYVHGVTSNIQTQINAITGAGSFQPGMGQPFFGSSIPAGWLLCDGSAVSRTTYSNLFGAIGTTYGPGDGSTTFNLPQGINYTMVGQGGSIAGSLGTQAGSATHTLTVAEIPANLTVTDTGHTHPYGAASPSISVDNTGSTRVVVPGGSNNQNLTASAMVGIAVGGGGTAHSIVQPSLGINWIIKT